MVQAQCDDTSAADGETAAREEESQEFLAHVAWRVLSPSCILTICHSASHHDPGDRKIKDTRLLVQTVPLLWGEMSIIIIENRLGRKASVMVAASGW